ncbi:MAG: acid phosphatase AphA [Candidatus Riflebacteria bacterium]|nr:acid phosphatase AphA [Candidatus Riflebacteria bacterium]
MKNRRILIALLFVMTLAFAQAQPKEFKTTDHYIFNTITVEEIAASLPDKPIVIGLDVDDTVLMSSPGFYYAVNNTDGPNKTNIYGERPLNNEQFWIDMSSKYDKFSMPKHAARKILEMHNKRGDKIYFITARPAIKGEILTEILHRTFNLKNQPPVIFSGKTPKSEFITKHGISIFYGDADSDVQAAFEAGIRAIRVMRSPISTNYGKYQPGHFGEFVLENSEN